MTPLPTRVGYEIEANVEEICDMAKNSLHNTVKSLVTKGVIWQLMYGKYGITDETCTT